MHQLRIQVGEKKLLFKEGEEASKLYMILSGEVLCLKQSKDRLIPIFTAKENDLIGENSMLVDGKYSYSAVTTTAIEVIEIPSSHFKTVFGQAPEWLVELTKTMLKRFQHTANLIAENRIIHSAIVDEAVFTPESEVEFKKLLS